MNWHKWLLTTSLTFGVSALTFAQGPTPAQIQQFKSMPAAQQQQMAKTMGIDLGSLGGSNLNAQPQITQKQNRVSRSTIENTQGHNNEAQQPEHESTELKQFGYSLFNDNPNSLQAPTDIPVPANYIMGPGDTLVVQLYGKDNSTHSLAVNREGLIQFPQIGPISFAGLTFSQAQTLIHQTVKKQMIGVKASVTMGALRSIRIFVLGEVSRPGSFTVGALSTMTNALLSGGGITKVGSLRNIQLKRQGQLVASLDLYDLLLKGDTSRDSRLLPGDVIFVPPIGSTVSIHGAVNRPAIYELSSQTDAKTLIRLAGGIKNNSHLPISQITRFDAYGEKDLINIDLSSNKGMSYTLINGDKLNIPSKLNVVSRQVELKGHIKRSGFRPWRKGQRLTDLVPSALALLSSPDLGIALIQSSNAETGKSSARLFSPKNAWANPRSDADPILRDYDIVHFFNFTDARPELLEDLLEQLSNQSQFSEIKKVVSISGSVRFPGEYPLAVDMTSQNLIALAGGLTESALDTNGEITRYGLDANRQREVTHLPIDFNQSPQHLEAGDILQVKQIPLWKDKETVTVSGEVIFPGTYSILPGETLTEVLSRAGGFTEHAYPVGAVLSRDGLRALEKERLAELKKQLESDIAASNANEGSAGGQIIGAEEAELLLSNLDSIKPAGRMVIDLPNVIASPVQNDVMMENGDVIAIPRYKPSVTVVGEVQYPTSHFYQASIDAMEYIDRSGGFKKHADNKRVYIVKANGSVVQPSTSAWFKANKPLIQAGDTIVVPLDTDEVDSLTVWAKVSQIVGQFALGIAALNSL